MSGEKKEIKNPNEIVDIVENILEFNRQQQGQGMSGEEKEIKNPNEIVDIVENILEFNRQQQGQGIKILTQNQMLSRLPIFLAQLKAGNNSKKLKNESRQILYSLYRSKLTKQIYKSLTDII